MSFSFDFTVATKAEAKERVAAELDEVIKVQKAHAKDRSVALATAHTYIDLLADDDTKDIRVTVHGSVSWPHNPADPYGENDPPLSAASVGVTAWYVPKSEVQSA